VREVIPRILQTRCPVRVEKDRAITPLIRVGHMKPLYALFRERCGLSISEAAEYHGVSESSVKSWCSGRRVPPDGVLNELRLLYGRIEVAARYPSSVDAEWLPAMPDGIRGAVEGLRAIIDV